MDVKNLIAALRNKDVVDAFASALQPTLSELKSSIDELRKEISAKDTVISCLSAEVSTLKEENVNMSTSLTNCRDRLDMLETYTRVDNLIIKGMREMYAEAAETNASYNSMANNSRQHNQQQQQLPDENSDSTMSLVVDFCSNILGIDIQLSDISIAHRMPKGKQDKFRPVLVRFSNRHTRDSVYRARRKLSGSNNNGIYINEHLTKQNDELFLGCRQLKKQRKIYSTWTWHGISYVKCSETSRAKKILTKADLDQLN